MWPFKKKIVEPVKDSEELFWDSLEHVNECWRNYRKDNLRAPLRPWIDWKEKEVQMTTFENSRAYRCNPIVTKGQ